MKIVRKKKVSKLLRSKSWPFTVNSIVIYNMACTSVYCEINGVNYALNGFAQDKLKLPHVIDSEYFIKGKGITFIIEIGLKMFSDKEVEKLRKINKDIKIFDNK